MTADKGFLMSWTSNWFQNF